MNMKKNLNVGKKNLNIAPPPPPPPRLILSATYEKYSPGILEEREALLHDIEV